MNVSSPRSLVLSLAAGIGISVVGGTLYALLADKIILYAIGAIMLIIGIISLAMGLLGALEPEDGWVTQGGSRNRMPNRSVAARTIQQHPELEDHSSLELAVWALAVGLPLIGLSIVCLNLSA